MELPKVTPIEIAFPAEGHPYILNVNFDSHKLGIKLNFSTNENPVFLKFQYAIGFRILNDRDLHEYWDNKLRLSSWFWKEEKKMWTENKQSASKSTNNFPNELTEFIMLGSNYSISILAKDRPMIV